MSSVEAPLPQTIQHLSLKNLPKSADLRPQNFPIGECSLLGFKPSPSRKPHKIWHLAIVGRSLCRQAKLAPRQGCRMHVLYTCKYNIIITLYLSTHVHVHFLQVMKHLREILTKGCWVPPNSVFLTRSALAFMCNLP